MLLEELRSSIDVAAFRIDNMRDDISLRCSATRRLKSA